ncbi:YesK family protein [Saliterribacillus persicus]|uniref:YesK-like protein n=1 Tax=Saliterribacillus persicus TaxID=930114 RepID=A0A368XC11_9BACI|nr:YesK family protein [Saliterribacillus persicus]RCW64538.1 YesK-like protein [Saliterribacillus persicus]
MEGFEFFVYISLGVIVLYAITSMLLKRNKYDKYVGIVFVGLLSLSIVTIVISFIVGGWAGMGVGFIGLSILIGAIIGGLISSLISFSRPN